MDHPSTAKIRQLSMLNLLLEKVDGETTFSECWGYLSVFQQRGGERMTWENTVVVLGDVSQSTVQIPTLAGFEIFLLLGCLPFLSSLLHLTRHLPWSSSLLFLSDAVCKLRLKSDDYNLEF